MKTGKTAPNSPQAGDWRRTYGGRNLHRLQRKIQGTAWTAVCGETVFRPQPSDDKDRQRCQKCVAASMNDGGEKVATLDIAALRARAQAVADTEGDSLANADAIDAFDATAVDDMIAVCDTVLRLQAAIDDALYNLGCNKNLRAVNILREARHGARK